MYIPLDLGNVQESKPVASGYYDLVVTGCEETKTKEKGKPQLKITVGIIGHEDAPNVMHFVGLPAPGDEPKAATFKALLLKRFLVLFKVPHSAEGFDIDDVIGATAHAELILDEPDDKGNVYNRLQVPRLKDEESEAAASRKPPKR